MELDDYLMPLGMPIVESEYVPQGTVLIVDDPHRKIVIHPWDRIRALHDDNWPRYVIDYERCKMHQRLLQLEPKIDAAYSAAVDKLVECAWRNGFGPSLLHPEANVIDMFWSMTLEPDDGKLMQLLGRSQS